MASEGKEILRLLRQLIDVVSNEDGGNEHELNQFKEAYDNLGFTIGNEVQDASVTYYKGISTRKVRVYHHKLRTAISKMKEDLSVFNVPYEQ